MWLLLKLDGVDSLSVISRASTIIRSSVARTALLAIERESFQAAVVGALSFVTKIGNALQLKFSSSPDWHLLSKEVSSMMFVQT